MRIFGTILFAADLARVRRVNLGIHSVILCRVRVRARLQLSECDHLCPVQLVAGQREGPLGQVEVLGDFVVARHSDLGAVASAVC